MTMQNRILAVGAAVGAAFSALSTVAVVQANEQGMAWLVPVAVVCGLAGTAISAGLAAYRASGA